jgi:hypothetical protein
MWFGLFLLAVMGYMVWDIVNDPHYSQKIDDLTEE